MRNLIGYLKLLRKKNQYRIGKHQFDLIIFDNFLPSRLSPWRSFEFSEYLEIYKNSKIILSTGNYRNYSLGESFTKNKNYLVKEYPNFKIKLRKIFLFENVNTRLFYCLFFNNISANFEFLKRKNIPFMFTLYPGGGFEINNESINNRLKEICSAQNFKGIIVNQSFIKKYLIKSNICSEDMILYVPGSPTNLDLVTKEPSSEKFLISQELKIAFVANKYMKGGKDKGFDIFIITALKLLETYPEIEFHIVGDFNPEDLIELVLPNHSNFFFHGQLSMVDLNSLLFNTHIVISPNQPFMLKKYSFDGFPLNSCVLGGLNLNALLMTDYFFEAEASKWENEKHFVKIYPKSEEIVRIVIDLYLDREKLYNLALNARDKIIESYSWEKQIKPRIQFIENSIS